MDGTPRREFVFDDGVLREPVPDGGRVVFWLPCVGGDGSRHWERVGTVPRAPVSVDRGVCSTPATSTRARPRAGGFLGGLVRRFAGADRVPILLPNGETAEPCGGRRADLLLVWASHETTRLDETAVRARWPESPEVRKVGRGLFLVTVAPPSADGGRAGLSPATAPPRQAAERLLAAARGAGDRGREASALTDFGVVLMREGDPRGSAAALDAALAVARQAGDLPRQADALVGLGWASVNARQDVRAVELFQQAIACGREAGDRVAEKLGLEHLASAYSRLREHGGAAAAYEAAAAAARSLGDRHHEAGLLWEAGVAYAELGRHAVAGRKAQEAVGLFAELGAPEAEVFAGALERFLRAEADLLPEPRLAGTTRPAAGSDANRAVTTAVADPSAPVNAGRPAQRGPGLLRMAFSLSKALAKNLASGLKSVTEEDLGRRLSACAGCAYHTGVRCRVCGCVTKLKAKMPTEACPLGKWPAASA